MTPPLEFSEPRRSFVKKTLATSVSISFAGLIRAHGDEGSATTTWNPDQTTYATTVIGTTTTWNPDETTVVTTTILHDVSLQKQLPHPVSDPDIPTARTTSLVSPAGSIKIMIGNQLFCNFAPQWNIRVLEQATVGEPYKTVLEDCVTYRTQVEIEVDLFPVGGIPAGALADVAVAVCNGFGMILAPGQFPQQNIIIPVVGADAPGGPNLAVGYSVAACWGPDAGIPGRVGPLVTVGDRLGTVTTSSYGYWLTVDSRLSPCPDSQSVEFKWTLRLRQSCHINLKQHIRRAILDQLNGGAIQAIVANNPNSAVIVDCNILPPPLLPNDLLPFSQLVLAFDLPPDACGTSCEVLDPFSFGENSGMVPLSENPPDDPRWVKPDPTIPPCPPLPPTIV